MTFSLLPLVRLIGLVNKLLIFLLLTPHVILDFLIFTLALSPDTSFPQLDFDLFQIPLDFILVGFPQSGHINQRDPPVPGRQV